LATNLSRQIEWHFLQNSYCCQILGKRIKTKYKQKHQNFSFSFQKFAVFRLVYVFLVHWNNSSLCSLSPMLKIVSLQLQLTKPSSEIMRLN
jgi:hypothetical protein